MQRLQLLLRPPMSTTTAATAAATTAAPATASQAELEQARAEGAAAERERVAAITGHANAAATRPSPGSALPRA